MSRRLFPLLFALLLLLPACATASAASVPVYCCPKPEDCDMPVLAQISPDAILRELSWEEGYSLVQYALEDGSTPFGYVDENILTSETPCDAVTLLPRKAYTTEETAMTDDPFGTQRAIVSLPGHSQFTVLLDLGDWVFGETHQDYLTPGDRRRDLNSGFYRRRGFVRKDHMRFGEAYPLKAHADAAIDGDSIVTDGVLTISPDNWMSISLTLNITPLPESIFLINQDTEVEDPADPPEWTATALPDPEDPGTFRYEGPFLPGITHRIDFHLRFAPGSPMQDAYPFQLFSFQL